MKLSKKVVARMVVSVAVGLVLAAVGTKVTYNCPLTDGAKGCVSFEKAIMHPRDLADNKQGSLVNFSVTFIATALISFGALSLLKKTQVRKK